MATPTWYLQCVNGNLVQVDKEDWEQLKGLVWYSSKVGVCRKEACLETKTQVRTVYLHRELMGEPEGLYVGFKDGDKLNCRRQNLFTFEPGRKRAALARLGIATE